MLRHPLSRFLKLDGYRQLIGRAAFRIMRKMMIWDLVWIWVWLVSLWVVISVQRRISRNQPESQRITIIDHPYSLISNSRDGIAGVAK
jgi:hypothetical protein